MSQYNYLTKPDWSADGSKTRASAATNLYPSRMGWVAPIAGKKPLTISAMTWLGGVVTATSVAHGMVSGMEVLVTGVSPAGYNGYVPITVTGVDAFTYPLAVDPGASTVQGVVYKNIEVVVAISSLDTVYTDAFVAPTYTAAVTYSGTAAMVTGDIITVTLTANEPVEVQGAPRIALTVGAATRQMALHSTSTSTSLVFKYTIVALDSAIAGGVVVAAATNGGYVSDVLPQNKKQLATVTFTAPDVSLATAN